MTPSVSDTTNSTLYATFAVVGFFAGTIVNALGIRVALSFGGLGYCIYTSSYLCYKHTSNRGYTYFAGALLGCCAGILWSAQGAIMMSYPPEKDKGRYISWFWMIFNLGAVIGSLIALGLNANKPPGSTGHAVSDGTYVGFIILTFLGACLSWTLVDAKHIVRRDGSRVILMKHPTWKTEIFGLWETLCNGKLGVALFAVRQVLIGYCANPRSVRCAPFSDVLRLQLVLYIPIQRRERGEVRLEGKPPQRYPLLACADLWSPYLRLCAGLP